MPPHHHSYYFSTIIPGHLYVLLCAVNTNSSTGFLATSLEVAHKIRSSTSGTFSTALNEPLPPNSKKSAMSEDRTMLKLCEKSSWGQVIRNAEMRRGLKIIYPYAPWLGPSPHGIDDPEQQATFGLVQAKYPNGWSYVNWLCILLLMGQLNWENPIFISGRSNRVALDGGWVLQYYYKHDDLFF